MSELGKPNDQWRLNNFSILHYSRIIVSVSQLDRFPWNFLEPGLETYREALFEEYGGARRVRGCPRYQILDKGSHSYVQNSYDISLSREEQ